MTDTLTKDQIIVIRYGEWIARMGCSVNQQCYIVPISYTFNGKHLLTLARRAEN